MDNDTAFTISCTRGARLDSNKIFKELHDRWLAAKPDRIGTDLCRFLESRKQIVSGYVTNTDNRRAPLWVLMRLADDLGLEIRLTTDEVVLTKKKKTLRRDDQLFSWATDNND